MNNGVTKAGVAVLLCGPEILSLMQSWTGFNMFSSLATGGLMLVCFLISIGLATSAIRKGSDAAWALGFVAMGIHVCVLSTLLIPRVENL